MWLTLCNELPPRKVPDKAVEAWAASITYCVQEKHIKENYGLGTQEN